MDNSPLTLIVVAFLVMLVLALGAPQILQSLE